MDAPGGVPEPCSRRRSPSRTRTWSAASCSTCSEARTDSRDDRRGRGGNCVPHLIPIDGGFPESFTDEVFATGQAHLLDVDDDTEVAFFAVESREESVMTAVRVHLPTRATESLWQSTYGAYVAAWTPDLSRIVLADGYTIGDVVLYEIDDARARRCSSDPCRGATRTRSTLTGSEPATAR